MINFNPRSRTGSDKVMTSQYMLETISIHAPARGATPGDNFLLQMLRFQSTLPHGERLPMRASVKSYFDFNPRSRTGSDHKIIAIID